MTERPRSKEETFELKKRQYFFNLARSVRSELKLHKKFGLLLEYAEGKGAWRNVSEHCLVEAARVREFAELVGLSEPKKRTLVSAAALHDLNKKREIEGVRAAEERGTSTLEASIQAEEAVHPALKEAGFSDEIFRLTAITGANPHQLIAAKEMLQKEQLTEEELALLILHYVDGYTIGSNWASPASVDAHGQQLNDVDRRLKKNVQNPAYAKIQKEQEAGLAAAHPSFKGKTLTEGVGLLWHDIERRLCELIKQRSGITVDPLDIPEMADLRIKARIEKEVL